MKESELTLVITDNLFAKTFATLDINILVK